MVRNGGVSIPDDAILTPSAREALQDLEMNGGPKSGANGGPAVVRPPTAMSPTSPANTLRRQRRN